MDQDVPVDLARKWGYKLDKIKKEDWIPYVKFYYNSKNIIYAYALNWIFNEDEMFTRDEVYNEKNFSLLNKDKESGGIKQTYYYVIMEPAKPNDKNILLLTDKWVVTTVVFDNDEYNKTRR